MPTTHHHQHHPERLYLTLPLQEFPRRFGIHSHPTPPSIRLTSSFKLRRQSDYENLFRDIGIYCKGQIPFIVTFGENMQQGMDDSEIHRPVVAGRERVMELHCGLLAVVGTWADILDPVPCGEQYTPYLTTNSDSRIASWQVAIWSVLVVGKYVKDEHRMNDPDKEFSDGFRMRGRIG